MKLEFRMVIVLTLIAIFSGFVLSYTYISTRNDIEKNAEMAKKNALIKVLPATKDYEEKIIDKETTLLIAKDENGKIIGYAAMTEGAGFQGKIKLMVGFDNTLTHITGLEILENVETPGLGNRIEEDWFKEQYKNRVPPITYVKGKKPEKENEIQAITGATISSKSVVKIVNAAHEKLRTFLKLNPKPQPCDESSSKIGKKTEKEIEIIVKAIKELAPETKEVTEIDDIFIVEDSEGNKIGYAGIGVGEGYNGEIKMIALFDISLKYLKGVRVLEHCETAGVGSKIENPEFLNEFTNKTLPLQETEIDVITGATISSKSLIEIVNNVYERIKKELKK
ncbi:MAG TPA: RnfABCDGE type electron transport complex subunit G [candidate division WOR-3 bacterium]|uniref:Ion-translocating oxidoreductase complex subunit G n=1 Tax=candidate division WOR-3 bacterium TaxID=2052148 RepID=A0A7C5MA62_UNCW3|nr:RnfABCDGE type electron transport complex subunit G [candidate division WOR-3 bacterium]